MNTAALIDRIRRRAQDPRLRTSLRAQGLFERGGGSELPPPISEELINKVERKMGFRLPMLLRRLYTEIGNGGFGPGYGLYGLTGGFADDVLGLTLPELYQSMMEYEWPEKVVPVCDWGCTMASAVDCSSMDGEMIFLGDSSPRFMPESISFPCWIEDWASGIDLFERTYRRYQKRERPTLPPPFENL